MSHFHNAVFRIDPHQGQRPDRRLGLVIDNGKVDGIG